MADRCTPEGKLDLAAVSQLHEDLVGLAGKDVILDLEQVTQLGALCVQTCIAAARAAQASGTSFEITNASDHVLSQISSMGLTPEAIMEGAK